MAFEVAYAQRLFIVGPMRLSSTSEKGTFTPLPYTSEVEAISTLHP